MFAPPPVIDSSVFLEVPKALWRSGTNQWVESQSGGAADADLPRGPSFDREGNLWVTDIPWGRLFKITPKGEISIALEYDGEPNGLKFHKDGRAFIADHKHGIMVFDPRTGRIDRLLDRVGGERFKGVNDLVFAMNGDLYFTDRGRPGCMIRQGVSSGCGRAAGSSSSSTGYRAPTASCSTTRRTRCSLP